jgi:hypothetical protein
VVEVVVVEVAVVLVVVGRVVVVVGRVVVEDVAVVVVVLRDAVLFPEAARAVALMTNGRQEARVNNVILRMASSPMRTPPNVMAVGSGLRVSAMTVPVDFVARC